MLDRIELIFELNKQPLKLSITAQRGLEKTLNKAIAQMIVGLTLPEAQKAGPSLKRLISESFDEALSMAELKKVSKLWEPKRTVPAGIAQGELARDLLALMQGERSPFEPTKLSLAQAQSLGGRAKAELVTDLKRFATLPQLKAILKKWDKSSPLATKGDLTAVRAELLSLLEG